MHFSKIFKNLKVTLQFVRLLLTVSYRTKIGGAVICAVGSKRRIFSAPECVLAVQVRSRSSKVDDFGTNRLSKARTGMRLPISHAHE